MHGVWKWLLLVFFASFALPFPEIPTNFTDTVMNFYSECFDIFLQVTMYIHGSHNVTEIPSQMRKKVSFCFNTYAQLCKQGTSDGYISTQQDAESSFQENITYDSVMGWKNFTDEYLTYQEAYCMTRVIAVMMVHSQVNLCSVLSMCSTATNSTRCEETYTALLKTLQENCHWPLQDSNYETAKTCTYNCIDSILSAVVLGIVALFVSGAYAHKYIKNRSQCSRCTQRPQPHCSLPLRGPPANIPVGQHVSTLPGPQENTRMINSANRNIHHAIQHHNFKQEFGGSSIDLARFSYQQQGYNCAEVPGDSVYETCNFGESVSDYQNLDAMEYMEALHACIPGYFEIFPYGNENEIPVDNGNQEQVELENPYVMVGEVSQSIQHKRQADQFPKEMLMANEKYERLTEQINLKNVFTEDTMFSEAGRLDNSLLLEELPFMEEIQDEENLQNKGTSSLYDDLVEIVIENENQQISENGTSLTNGM